MAMQARQLELLPDEPKPASGAGDSSMLHMVDFASFQPRVQASRQVRVACLAIPHFLLEIEFLSHPELRGRPVVIGGAPSEKQAVVDCSVEAEQYGITPDLQLRQALARCHSAVFLEARTALYEETNAAIYQALYNISPTVQAARLGHFFVDLTGMTAPEEKLLEQLRAAVFASAQITPHAAIASGKFASYAAALEASDSGKIVPPRQIASFVGRLSCDHLPVTPEMRRQLRLLGLKTLGDIARLPRSAMQAEFGPQGQKAWDLSHGLDTDSVQGQKPAQQLQERLHFDDPMITTAGMMMGVQLLLSSLGERLAAEGRMARGLRIRADLTSKRSWQKLVNFHEPSADTTLMARAVKAAIERQPWRAAVEDLEITLWETCPTTGIQPDLFPERNGARQRLDAALRHLGARYRPLPVYRLVQPEPDSRVHERRFALASYMPDINSSLKPIGQPRPIQARAGGHGDQFAPSQIFWRGAWMNVVVIRQQFRIEDEWWSREISRRYFRLVLSNGRHIVVFWDGKRWFQLA